jgi:hypothetical protein
MGLSGWLHRLTVERSKQSLEETARQRASRDFPSLFVGLPGFVWTVAWGAAAIGATIYLSPHHSLRAQVGIGVGLFLAGVVWAAVSFWGLLYVTAPAKQRDEARAELATAQEKAKFPRGRIEVKNLGYTDMDDKERLLIFTVKVTNRELAQRMNLEVDFLLRMFTRVTKFNPGLKPLDVNLKIVKRGKNPPPRPLTIDAQHSPPEFHYTATWDEHDTGLVFEDDGYRFRPELEDDALFLSVFDLQSGGRIEIPIPGIWES